MLSFADCHALVADIPAHIGAGLGIDTGLITSASIPALGAGAVAIYYAASSLWSWFRLRHVPGPWLASFSYLWFMRVNARGISARELVRISRQYGSATVRIAPNYVLTTDTQALRRISAPARGSTSGGGYVRDSWWEGLRIDAEGVDNMLTTMDNAAHDHLKARTAAGYSGRDGVDIEASVDEALVKLKELIRRSYTTPTSSSSLPSSAPVQAKKKVADLAWLVRFFTLDSITALAYGESFGYLDADADLHGFNAQLADMTVSVAVMLNTPVLRALIKSPLGPYMMPRATDKDGMGKLIGIGQDFVARHFKSEKASVEAGADMVSSFMRHGLSQKQCEVECQVQIIAGADTTGTTIRTALLYVLSTPRIYNRLLKEITAAVTNGAVDADSVITYQQARKLPYLQAVIYEALRVRPPALYGHFKRVPPGGDTVGGVFLPGGTAVGHNLFGIMMARDVFGDDAETFRPERLIVGEPGGCSDAAHKAEMERVIELAFGSGRWMCAGKLVAFTQLSKVLFELLREFDMQFVDPGRPWVEDAAMFWRQLHMHVRISERTDMGA
ncbi:cytochrome P450 [Microdochium bolleyi]|uniref:Cytochrome P450 n=1 Tax=Microdochium bolleyi TaxID=196109 RepID=A0A136JGK7_9PEZI|nr:cytochrome P450 [Microdochium bolleyi]